MTDNLPQNATTRFSSISESASKTLLALCAADVWHNVIQMIQNRLVIPGLQPLSQSAHYHFQYNAYLAAS